MPLPLNLTCSCGEPFTLQVMVEGYGEDPWQVITHTCPVCHWRREFRVKVDGGRILAMMLPELEPSP